MKYTIGYERDDGDLDVIATFNLENIRWDEEDACEDCIESIFKNTIQSIVEICEDVGDRPIVLEQEDTTDVVACEGKVATEFNARGTLH